MMVLVAVFWLPLSMKAVDAITGSNKSDLALLLSVASFAVLCVIFWRVRIWAWRRLESQAQKEAAENEGLTPEELSLKEQEVARQSKRFEGWSLLAIGAALMCVFMYVLPVKAVDIRTVSFGELAYNKTYYIDELIVIDSYAVMQSEEGGNERKYYLAVFTDKDGKRCFISFFTHRDIKSYPERVSAYVLTERLPDTKLSIMRDEETGEWYVPSMEYFYGKARKVYAWAAEEASEMNARYVCAPGESILWHELTADNYTGLIVLILPLISFVCGAYRLVKYKA